MKSIWILFCLLISLSSEANESYELAFEHFVNNSNGLFQFSDNFLNQIQKLDIEPEIKNNLIRCATEDKLFYLKDFIPIFQRYLTADDLNKASNWLMSKEGKLWFNIHNGLVNVNELAKSQIEQINEFASGKIMRNLDIATKESIDIAPSSSQKFVDHCIAKSGL